MPEDPIDQAHPELAPVWRAYRLCRPTAGLRLLRSLWPGSLAADDGHCWYVYACLLEQDGRFGAADRAFRAAARAKQHPHPAPFRVGWKRFLHTVERSGDALTTTLQAALAEVQLVLADYPDPDLVDQVSDDGELLGYFEGHSKADDDRSDLPARIHVYRRPHEHAVVDRHSFENEITSTLHHELGHYLGFDESDMAHFGLD